MVFPENKKWERFTYAGARKIFVNSKKKNSASSTKTDQQN